jgi:hypothetical protein
MWPVEIRVRPPVGADSVRELLALHLEARPPVGADSVRELLALEDDTTCEQRWPLIAASAHSLGRNGKHRG